jgi:hypothetical protein
MDKAQLKVSSINAWKAARQFPETYPGDCPPQSYFILNNKIYFLRFETPLELWFEDEAGGVIKVDDTLKKYRLPLVRDRYTVLAYGANRNPATLHIKFQNYNYRCPGNALAVPVLHGEVYSADVVACAFSGQGYFYGDLSRYNDWTQGTQVKVWLLLLDKDQLRAINDSEGVRAGDYIVARFDDVKIDGCEKVLSPMGYAARKPALTSPQLRMPLGFKSVQARGRVIPEMSPLQMLDHLMDAFDLRKPFCDIIGIQDSVHLAAKVAKYMNGQWWHQFSTQQQPIQGYQDIMRLFDERMTPHALLESTSDQLISAGKSLSVEASYHPDRELTFGRLLEP